MLGFVASVHKLVYTYSLKLGLSHQGKNTLRVCENRVLRRIFGPKREEVAGGWRRLHNDKR
jgi:hypothetical protein